MSHVKITAPGPIGIGTEVEVDGVKQKLVTRVQLDLNMNNTNVLTLHQRMPSCVVSGEFDVEHLFSFPDQPDKKYRLVEVKE